MAAALDHLMRSDPHKDTFSNSDLDRVCGHLKRATFDAFKMLYEHLRDLYRRLRDPDFKIVDNGDFLPRIERRWHEAREINRNARKHESLAGNADPSEWDAAFDEWSKLIPIYLMKRMRYTLKRMLAFALSVFAILYLVIHGDRLLAQLVH